MVFLKTSPSFWRAKPTPFLLEKAESNVEIITAETMVLSRKFESSVVMWMGRRGQGKTLAMTNMAQFRRDQHALPHCHTQRIAANYWMLAADLIRPDMLEWLNTFDPAVRDMFVCLDEIGSQVANRKSLRAGNVDFAQLLVQIRKRQIEMAFATQFPQTVDWQVLMQVDLFLDVTGFDFDYRGIPHVIKVRVADWWGQWTGKNWRKAWPPKEEDWDGHFYIENAHVVADQYRSEMVIPPNWAKNKDQIIINEWGDLLSDTDYQLGQEATTTGADFMNMDPTQKAAQYLSEGPDVFYLRSVQRELINTVPELKDANDVREALASGAIDGKKHRIFKEGVNWMAERLA